MFVGFVVAVGVGVGLGCEEEEEEEGEGLDRGVVANWKRTLTRSRGCMMRVATVPAPRPARAWSYVPWALSIVH